MSFQFNKIPDFPTAFLEIGTQLKGIGENKFILTSWRLFYVCPNCIHIIDIIKIAIWQNTMKLNLVNVSNVSLRLLDCSHFKLYLI